MLEVDLFWVYATVNFLLFEMICGIVKAEKTYNGKESRAGHTTLCAIAAFKGGGFKGLSIEIGPLPLTGAAYFFLWKDRINTTRVANEIISVNAWYTSTGITSLPGD
ncbi:hypothetical protein LOS79_21105 [Paenibacillus sp. MMS20-IR301]|nr:hypothetical protein [Paenibacillus sp. MMS20-IR301]WNS41508.1 hypothetical protein LOS79_21105 [Paenibacillus sp. MMS20-IR301]